jgi:rod shape-determining protein MreD
MRVDVTSQAANWRHVVYWGITGVILVSLQTTSVARLWPQGHGPDLGALMMVYLGFRAPQWSGTGLAYFLGLVRDAGGGTPLGFHSVLYLALWVVVHLVRQRLDPARPWHLAAMAGLAVLAANLAAWAALFPMGRHLPLVFSGWSSPGPAFFSSIGLSALAAPVLFWLIGIWPLKESPTQEPEA